MKKFDLVLAWLLVALGVLHCCATFAFYKSLVLNAVWFFAAGIAFLAVGFCNIARIRHSSDALLRVLSVIANAFSLLVCIAFIWIFGHAIASAPQAIVVGLVVLLELIFSATAR